MKKSERFFLALSTSLLFASSFWFALQISPIFSNFNFTNAFWAFFSLNMGYFAYYELYGKKDVDK